MLTRIILATVLVGVTLVNVSRAAGEAARPTPHEHAAIAASKGPRLWYHEEEFLRDPALRATPDHVVILHLARASKHRRFVDHAIPYFFAETATYTFCMPKEEPFLQDLELIREGSRKPVVTLKHGAKKCKTKEIAAGFYRLQVQHDGARIGPKGKKAFIHVPRLKGSARVGSQSGGLQVGETLSSFPSLCDSDSLNNPLFTFTTPDGMFVNPIFTSNNKIQTTATAEVSFGWSICPDGSGNVTLGNSLFGGYFFASGPSNPDTALYAMKTPTPFSLTDLGNGQFTLAANFSGGLYPIVLGTDHALHWANPGTTPTVFTVQLKYYVDLSADTSSLQPGDVALYRGCNYDTSAGTWVFTTTVLNFASYTIFFTSADNMFGSVKIGPQTQAVLFAGANSSGQEQIVAGDIPCLSNTPLGAGTASSLLITPYRNFLVATDTCLNCDLSSLDLSGLNLAGGRFQGSTLTGANLAGANFQSASLDNANINGATTVLANTNLIGAVIRCTNFSGADLSSATFQFGGIVTPIVTTDFSCRADLTGATFNLNSFPLTQWRYFNLTGAKVNGVTGATLSTTASRLDLSGAILNHSVLPKVILDGANLGCASTASGPACAQLMETSLTSASLKKVNFVSALLQGAHLDSANLDGANLCSAKLNKSPTSNVSATLEGAFLRNVNLAQGDLTGAHLKYANFYSSSFTTTSCNPTGCGFTSSCASAVNATLTDADFSSAYLNGVDFSGAKAQDVDFSNAWLAQANFTNANLSQNPGTGNPTDFTGAWLQGATFSGTTNVTGANFTSALVDLTHSSGQPLLMYLDPATHIAFPGYTAAQTSCTINGSFAQPCTLGCVKFATKQNTRLPGSDSTNLCPDGLVGPCNTTQWQTPKVLPPSLPPSCALITNGGAIVTDTSDLNWIIAN